MHRCTTTNTKASRKPSGELYLKVVSCTFSEHVRPYMPGPHTTSMLNFAQTFQTMDRLDLPENRTPWNFHGFKPHFTLEKRQHIGLKSHHWRNHESLDGPEAWSWIAASPDKSLHAYFSKSENGGFTPFLAIYREHSDELWDFEGFPYNFRESRISIKFQPQSLARTCAFLLRACRYMSDCTCVVCSISSKWEIFSTSIGTGFRACQKCQQHQKVKIENETTWLVVEPTPLKNMYESQWEGWHPIYEMENKKCLKPPTSHIYWGRILWVKPLKLGRQFLWRTLL